MFWNTALAEEVSAAAEVAVEETVKESWFTTAFGDMAEFPVWGWVLVAVLLVGGIMLWNTLKNSQAKSKWNTRMMSLGAMCMALSCVLSMIKLFEMPSGGSVTPASMLPLMLFAYVYGAGPGLMLGAIYGVLQYLLGGWFLNVPQVLIDYPVAFAMTGLAGLTSQMKKPEVGFPIGVAVASFGRYVAAVVAGVLFWAEYAPEGMSPLVYSLGYNATYMTVECIICAVLAVLMGKRLIKELRKNA